MGAVRKENLHFPKRLFAKNGAFWYVCYIEGKQIWQSLGRSESDSIARANALNEMDAQRRLATLGAVRRVEARLRDELVAASDYKCVYCGSTENLGIDHVIPFSAGGATAKFNLVCCCLDCNISKNDSDPKVFMLTLLGVRTALVDYALGLLDSDVLYRHR